MNTQAQFTPGAWWLKFEYSTIYVEGNARDPRVTQEVAAVGPKEGGREQQEADARLIAAAPDGYAFAESFLAWLEQLRKIRAPKDLLPGLEAREREARAFLAKAQGGAA